MTLDPEINHRNADSRQRIQALAQLPESALRTPVGEDWTVAALLAHLAFWDRRVMYVLDQSEQRGSLYVPEIDICVNDLSLPLWLAVPPQEAARLAVETAAALDARLQGYPLDLLGQVSAYNPRWVDRSTHRGEHLEDAELALRMRGWI